MPLPDLKALTELAKACRKAGIKHFKCDELEFTLTDDAPVSNYKRKTSELSAEMEAVASESLSEEELLFWSTNARVEGTEQ